MIILLFVLIPIVASLGVLAIRESLRVGRRQEES